MLHRPISARRFLGIFGLVGLVAPFVAMLAIQPVHGDLARIGRLPESAFGANASQAPRDRVVGTVERLADARLLVLGDSFSLDGVWQGAAFGKTLRFGTVRWNGVLCQDFPQVLQGHQAHPKVLVLQTVERHLKDRFEGGCGPPPVFESLIRIADEPRTTEPFRHRYWIFGGSFGLPYLAGSALFMLSPRAQHRSGDYGGVHVKAVPDGCARFSHSECGLGLFLGWDFTKNAIDASMPAIVHSGLTAAAGAVPTVFLVVVPDKSSVYLSSMDEAQRKDRALLGLAADNQVIVVPLFERFYIAARRIQDFYAPDDTHLSPAGYERLGQEIKAAIESRHPGLLASLAR